MFDCMRKEAFNIIDNILNIAEEYQQSFFVFAAVEDIGEEGTDEEVQIFLHFEALSQ